MVRTNRVQPLRRVAGRTDPKLNLAMRTLSRVWVRCWLPLPRAVEMLAEQGWTPGPDPEADLIAAVSRAKKSWVIYRDTPFPAVRFQLPMPSGASPRSRND